jgi:signal transduction histidine kinase
VAVLLALGLAARVLHALGKERRGMERRIDELELFASRVAHDVRSPLTPAVLALQRVGVSLPQNDPLRGIVERGSRSLRSIERIVDALLAFAYAGAEPQHGVSASLCEMLEAVVIEYADAATAAGIQLDLECEDGVDVACAPGVLVSIGGNLVCNAIKYMGESIERRIVVRGRTRGAYARLEVSDTGPGLPPGVEERIFDPYVRMADAGNGIGLGLATVRRLALAHAGSCGVGPRDGHGCVFWVELPLAPPCE